MTSSWCRYIALKRNINPRHIYTQDELARGPMVALTASPTTNTHRGVQYQTGGSAITHTIYGRSRSGNVSASVAPSITTRLPNHSSPRFNLACGFMSPFAILNR